MSRQKNFIIFHRNQKAILCAVASFLWLSLAILSGVILLRLRRMSAEMNKSSLGDAYQKFEEDERSVSVFTVDDENSVEQQPEKPESAAEASVASDSKIPPPPQHKPSSIPDEEELMDDIFTNSSNPKKTKKSKKHRKKTTGKSSTPPPDAEQ